MKDYKDYAPRAGSRHPLRKLADYFLTTLVYFLATLVSLFILALVGSAIWGNEGFVDLLASFF